MSRAAVGAPWAVRAVQVVVWPPAGPAGPGGLEVRRVPAVSVDRDGLAASRVPVVRPVLAGRYGVAVWAVCPAGRVVRAVRAVCPAGRGRFSGRGPRALRRARRWAA
ncbi:hypothetical protein SBI_04057 [Streptomyces bingchenggensis BCW-1]|uniref:Uncharacterized protein n=1 Tax=Streptomyces bingchenggensis (strain BCW-1) TaxID=749414 RepID=D7BQE9_STRBB|nr:hypothetical protein [Streptomyces milbemycinicus]ADI07178.1 hypothetical protein SBI_04057 [Streptomyces bingchenggensis BCW-1]